MLSAEENEQLTRVGAGTPMGDLLRCYWHPIAAAAELDVRPIKEVQIFGEKLVLYRDRQGNHGLVDRHCAHRRANLALGMVEQCGIRCSYHGWKYDHTGACLEQPFEDQEHPGSTFKDRIRLKAYPVEIKAGIVWAYLGSQPAPCLCDWDYYHRRGYKLVRIAEIPCNWLQCQENAIDPLHFEWLHDNLSAYQRGEVETYAAPHVRVRFEEFDHGFVYGRVRSDTDETNPQWTVGRTFLWPNGFVTHAISWLVPIDDRNTLFIGLYNFPLPGNREFQQERIPLVRETFDHRADRPPTSVSRFTLWQDMMAMVGQGEIADRSLEHLGGSDRGIILVRKRFLGDLKLRAQGQDPKAILRDHALNHRIALPFIDDRGSVSSPLEYFGDGLSPAVRDEIEQIWADHAGSEPTVST